MTIIFDNSVLSEFRSSKKSSIITKKIDFINEHFDKLQLEPKNAFLTERSFLEIIGQGDLREIIEKTHRSHFEKEKRKILEVLINSTKPISEMIAKYMLFLEDLFTKEFIKLFPQDKIFSTTHKNLKKYEFIPYFSSLESKLIRYSKTLTKQEREYREFIKILVEDSVVRFVLDSVDIRQIKPELHDRVFSFLNEALGVLLTRYRASKMLSSNLNLFMSVLKDNIEAKEKPNQKSKPIFKIYNDFADVELGYFPFYGKKDTNGLLTGVTVVTKEPPSRVEERLIYNFQVIGTKANEITPQELMLGRTIILDFHQNSCQEIKSKDFIQQKFKYLSGRQIL